MREPPAGGRTALVSGGGSGLGRAIAVALHEAGHRVIVCGRRREPLDETAQLLGGDVRVGVVDVADHESVAALRDDLVDETISILVNNAGVAGPVRPLVEIEPDEWDAVFAVNVRGMFLMCKAFIPPMVARGSGDVINLASVSGKRPLALRTPYTASKMAVIGLSTTLGAEVGPSGVRVNTLSPGPVRGQRMARNFRLEAEQLGISEAEAEARFAGRATSGRLIEESEVGDAVVAMLAMTGLHCADIDLSAGMVAR
jgi:NAD(P)-dependent dehydrogenase (short-subunit alcohol dehydrogenase family)